MSRTDLLSLVKEAAKTFALDWTFVDALVQAESGYNPWAVRNEPRFRLRYVDPIPKNQLLAWNPSLNRTVSIETERDQLAKSWGLMQVMGVVAREHGFAGPFLTQICEPRLGLFFGCKHLRRLYDRYGQDMESALEAYNTGKEDPWRCLPYAARILKSAKETKEKEGYAESESGSGITQGVHSNTGERMAERERDLQAVAI